MSSPEQKIMKMANISFVLMPISPVPIAGCILDFATCKEKYASRDVDKPAFQGTNPVDKTLIPSNFHVPTLIFPTVDQGILSSAM
jgi:hypothetical protein